MDGNVAMTAFVLISLLECDCQDQVILVQPPSLQLHENQNITSVRVIFAIMSGSDSVS